MRLRIQASRCGTTLATQMQTRCIQAYNRQTRAKIGSCVACAPAILASSHSLAIREGGASRKNQPRYYVRPTTSAKCPVEVEGGRRVSHLRRLWFFWRLYPGLTAWAKCCRAYGALGPEQEVQSEERSFVAKSAPLDDGQRRVGAELRVSGRAGRFR